MPSSCGLSLPRSGPDFRITIVEANLQAFRLGVNVLDVTCDQMDARGRENGEKLDAILLWIKASEDTSQQGQAACSPLHLATVEHFPDQS